jgi:DNA repair protein RadA/Sms
MVEASPPHPARPVTRVTGGASERSGSAAIRHDAQPVPLSEVGRAAEHPAPTGIDELDRVIGGGLVPGSVTLVGGEPGIGKSTLLLQAAAGVARSGGRTLLVASEESAEQVRRRAERLKAVVEGSYIVATADLQAALEAVGSIDPDLFVVDSIQTIGDPSLQSRNGSTTQVRECAQALAHYAKATSTATVLVGHVTKDGALAGPRALEHLVDTVLSFDGDRHHSLRHLCATKHRYGSTDELGLFEMTESGLVGLADPSSMLLADRRPGVAGSVVAPVIEGRRAILVEVQALVGDTRSPSPRRVVQGIPNARVALLLAVLERALGVCLGTRDVFISTVGGIKVAEPATDMAVALALVSAVSGIPVPATVVAYGEIGLAGEVRQSHGAARRLAEAARLGFGRAITPSSVRRPAGTMGVVQVATIAEAVEAVGLAEARRAGTQRDRAWSEGDRARTGVQRTGGTESRQGNLAAPPAVRGRKIGLTVVRD